MRTIKRWKELAWKAISKKKRAAGVCQKCGKTRDARLLDAHHLVPKYKGNYAYFEPDNIVVLCGFYCHRNWWHGSSTWDEQRDLIDSWIGLDRYYEIKRKAEKPVKYKPEDYERMINEWEGDK